MAALISNSNGNFTGSSNWSVINSTSFSNSEAGSTASTTSWVASTAFSPGSITTDGLAVKILSHTTTGNIAAKLGKSGSITNISIGNPTTITTAANHGLVTGEAILIAGTNSTPALTGPYTVTVTGATTFTVPVNVTVAGTAGTWSTVLATITSNSLAATPVFTTGVAHGLTAGTQITIKGSTSTPSYNGTWTVATTPTTTTFTLTGAPSSVGGVSGWGAYNITAASDTLVVIAANDLPTVNTATNTGWALFKFPASITLTTGASYTVQITGSTAANWTVYRTATAGDWARGLRTTTTQAPVAADSLIICGEYSDIGANSSYSVTMNNTNTTIFGLLEVCSKGSLIWGTSASTNYYLKLAGNLVLFADSTYTQGTALSPIPSSSTAKLEFACASNVQYGFEVRSGSTAKTGGNPVTTSAKLVSDVAIAATTLTTDISTNWKSGDKIALAATTRTRAECEMKTLSADAVGTTLTIAALTNAHSGTAPTQAELVNLTRNVQIFGTTTAFQSYVNIANLTVVDFQYCEFFQLGSATALKRGIDVATSTGSCTINGCSIHDNTVASSLGIFMNSATNNNYTVTNNVMYNIVSTGIANTATAGNSSYTISNNINILSGGTCFAFLDILGTITNLTAVGGTTQGISASQAGAATSPVFGTLSNWTAHSNTGPGINLTSITAYGNAAQSIITNLISWRNTTFGLVVNTTFNIVMDTASLFGNTTANISLAGNTGKLYFENIVANSGTTLTCPIGAQISASINDVIFDSCSFGATTTHATGDIQISTTNLYPKVIFRNCVMNSATPLANQTNMIDGGFIASGKHNQTAGNHRIYKKFGTITSDSTLFYIQSPSQRMTPNTANQKLQTDPKTVAVPNGKSVKISVYVRKSIAGDGSAYNGNQPRLIMVGDPATGLSTDVVLTSSTAAGNGNFELLQATTSAVTDDVGLRFYIDCDGTTGWVNVDRWSVEIL